jgi:tetratricopeptide (TPR) repeat protein
VAERLEQLPENLQPQAALADLYFAIALDLYPTGRYKEVLAAGERATQLARAARHERTPFIRSWIRGNPLSMMGRWAEARTVLEEALPVLEAMGDPWWLAHPIGNIARTYVHQGDLERGRAYWERALQLDEAAHDPAEVSWASCYLGDVFFITGDWIRARQQYERSASVARSAGAARYLGHVLLHLADLGTIEGKREEALRYVEEAMEVAEQVGDVPALRTAQRLLAERDLAEGHPERALARLQPLLDRLGGEEPHAFPPAVLAEACLFAGDLERASELVERRIRGFREQDHKRALALWLRVRGMVLGRQRRWEEADRVFAEAVSLAQAMPYPYAEGRARNERGHVLMERGEVEPAREQLQHALVIFHRLGAKQDIETTKQALNDWLGERGSP